MEYTVLVFDIRNFTSISNKNNTLELISIIKNILSKIIQESEKYDGEIINFTGDGLIYAFRCPMESIKVANEIRQIINMYNKEAHKNKKNIIQFGIGIHKGRYLTENIKINNKDFPISVGEGINLASKIESYTKEYMVDILVSDEIVQETNQKYKYLKMPPIKINGLKNKLNTHWLAPINKEFL